MKKISFKGDKLSKLSLGTVQFGLDYGIANSNGKPSQEQVNKIINYVNSKELNCFDTAQAYGNSEQVIGEALKEIDNKFIISKFKSDVFTRTLFESIEESLVNLKTNCLYGLLLHDSNLLYDWKDSYSQNVSTLIAEKKIKYFGVSIYNSEDFDLAIENDAINIIQIPFNIFDQRAINEKWFEKAKEKNKLIFIRSIYLQGLLLMPKEKLPEHLHGAAKFIETLDEVCKRESLSRNELALSFVDTIANESIILFGCDNLEQAKENISNFNNLSKLNSSLINQLMSDFKEIDESIYNPVGWNK